MSQIEPSTKLEFDNRRGSRIRLKFDGGLSMIENASKLEKAVADSAKDGTNEEKIKLIQ